MGNKHVNKRMLHKVFVATLTFVWVSVFATSVQVFAAPSTTTNSANTLKISPVRTDTSIAPGKSGVVTVRVDNLTSSPMAVSPVENDFVAGDEDGTPALILDADKYAPTHSLKRFMAPLQEVTIPAKSFKEVKLTINVPADASPGGYYGAIRFVPVTGTDSAQVSFSTSAASIILLSVPGDAVEKLALTNFAITQGSKSDSIFQSSNDLNATFRMANQGSIHEGPFGSITVKQGDKVVYDYKFNNTPPRDMILPDGARRWEVPLKNIGSFGNYTVLATFTYGTTNQTIEVSKSFWVIPQIVIIATIVTVILLLLIIIGTVAFIRTQRNKAHRRKSGLGTGKYHH